MTTPIFLQNAKDLLTKQGFATCNTWYYSTSSALTSSISEHGLKRFGDHALKAAAKKTMSIIGNHYTQSVEPIFLTQSKQWWYQGVSATWFSIIAAGVKYVSTLLGRLFNLLAISSR